MNNQGFTTNYAQPMFPTTDTGTAQIIENRSSPAKTLITGAILIIIIATGSFYGYKVVTRDTTIISNGAGMLKEQIKADITNEAVPAITETQPEDKTELNSKTYKEEDTMAEEYNSKPAKISR